MQQMSSSAVAPMHAWEGILEPRPLQGHQHQPATTPQPHQYILRSYKAELDSSSLTDASLDVREPGNEVMREVFLRFGERQMARAPPPLQWQLASASHRPAAALLHPEILSMLSSISQEGRTIPGSIESIPPARATGVSQLQTRSRIKRS